MKKRSVTHATFTVERTYDMASPAQVFNAWADPAAKARWFGGGDDEWENEELTLEFRVGGHYHDIVPNERIVYAYDMHLDDTRISVSLATVEMTPAGKGTRLVFTEQGAFLDGHDPPGQREEGTHQLLDQLGAELKRATAQA